MISSKPLVISLVSEISLETLKQAPSEYEWISFITQLIIGLLTIIYLIKKINQKSHE